MYSSEESLNNEYPKFAVVGHPNKGKSSIVSSLALDDSVQIGDTPGTTQVKRGFPLKVDGKIIYELFDTPGFQRARRVLSWLNEQEPVSADKKGDVVRAFIEAHRDDERFIDEIELLEPIMNGAGIIYVVDASKPYGAEYEVEMEILRWCGQPSMAILNLIGEEDYTSQWKSALGHYFRMVRTFNPIEATFTEHIELLDSMSQLKEEWTKPIKVAIAILEDLQKQKVEQSIDSIVTNMIKILSFVSTSKIEGESATDKEEERLKLSYRQKIVSYEKNQEKNIEAIWSHKSIEKVENILVLESVGLFSKESASIFGLSQQQLIITGASAGAIGGLGIDILLGGGSLFLGSLIGGAVGGVGAMMGFDNLYEVKVLGQSIGKRELSVGPMQNLNFPYILLGRSLYHASVIAKRSHAMRGDINLDNEEFFTEQIIDSDMRKVLEKVHVSLRKGEEIKEEELKAYKTVVEKSFIGLM
jgi:GTPase Era involved in 16S rRNA processing